MQPVEAFFRCAENVNSPLSDTVIILRNKRWFGALRYEAVCTRRLGAASPWRTPASSQKAMPSSSRSRRRDSPDRSA